MKSTVTGIGKGSPSDRRNETAGIARPQSEMTAAITAASHASPGSFLPERSVADPNVSLNTSGLSLPLPARLKDANEHSVDHNASSVNSDSASNADEEDDVGARESTLSANPLPSGEQQPNDTLKFIRQRNALYSRRKYYKRKQELERLEEMKHQLEVRNETLRRDNAQLERWMLLVQRQLPGERNAASSRQALLQRLLEQATSSQPSSSLPYSKSAAAAAALGNYPVTFTGIHDNSSSGLRASELQQLLQRPSGSIDDLLLHRDPRRAYAAPTDMRQLLLAQTQLPSPPAAANFSELSTLSSNAMEVSHPTAFSHLLSSSTSSSNPSLLQRSSSASSQQLLSQQQQLLPPRLQLLSNLRDQRTSTTTAAAFLDQARRKEEDQLLLLQLLQQQQQRQQEPSSLDASSSYLLGPLSHTPLSALPSPSQDALLLQLLQNKQREEQALLRQLSNSSREDMLWQPRQHFSPPKGAPPPR